MAITSFRSLAKNGERATFKGQPSFESMLQDPQLTILGASIAVLEDLHRSVTI